MCFKVCVGVCVCVRGRETVCWAVFKSYKTPPARVLKVSRNQSSITESKWGMEFLTFWHLWNFFLYIQKNTQGKLIITLVNLEGVNVMDLAWDYNILFFILYSNFTVQIKKIKIK